MRHPNQVNVYGPVRSPKGKPFKAPHEMRLESQQRDIEALKAIQESRPARPPVKSRRVW